MFAAAVTGDINYQSLKEGLSGTYDPGYLAYMGAYQVLEHDFVDDSHNTTVLDLFGGFLTVYFAKPDASGLSANWQSNSMAAVKYYLSQSERKHYANSVGLLVGIDFLNNGTGSSASADGGMMDYSHSHTGFSRLWLTNVSHLELYAILRARSKRVSRPL